MSIPRGRRLVCTDSGEKLKLAEREEGSSLSSCCHLSPPLLPAVLLLSSGEGGGGSDHRSLPQQLVHTREQLDTHTHNGAERKTRVELDVL